MVRPWCGNSTARAHQPTADVREVAERLAVCTATVYALRERGEIRHLRVSNAIRIHPDDLEAFIAGS